MCWLAIHLQQKSEYRRVNTWNNVKAWDGRTRENIFMGKKVFLPPTLQIWFETRRNNYDVLTSVKVSIQPLLPKQCTQFPQLLTEQSFCYLAF